MGLNWDRFDNAVSELWKFFAPALLNFILVTLLFLPVISSVSVFLINSLYTFIIEDSAFPGIESVMGELESKNLPVIWEAVSTSISAITLLTIVIFLIFVFLLDEFTKWIGSKIPLAIDVDREKIVSCSPAAGIFDPNCSAEAMATTWRHARHSLDAREALNFYKEKRKNADDAISQTINNFTYDKAYIAFSITGIISSIWFGAGWYVVLYIFLTLLFVCLAGRKMASIQDDYAKSIFTDMEVFYYISDEREREAFHMINAPSFQRSPLYIDGAHYNTSGFKRILKADKNDPVQIVLDISRLIFFPSKQLTGRSIKNLFDRCFR